MKNKTIALFMLVCMISAGTLFTTHVNAKEASASVTPAERNALSATNASIMSPGAQPGLALVTFVNHTPWTVQCYTDGQFRGVVFPMHSYSVWVASGYTVLAARADFIDATPAIWNSGILYYYSGGNYSWRLVP